MTNYEKFPGVYIWDWVFNGSFAKFKGAITVEDVQKLEQAKCRELAEVEGGKDV